MLKTLQTLFITLAAVTPLLAGVLVEASEADGTLSVASGEPSPLEGHRADEAGTRLEQGEEDDSEEDTLRDQFVVAVSGFTADALVADQRAAPAMPEAAAPPPPRLHLSRGPPSRR